MMSDTSLSNNSNYFDSFDSDLYFYAANKCCYKDNDNQISNVEFIQKRPYQKISKKSSRTGKEAAYIKKVLKNFDFKSSNTWKKIQERYSTGVRHTELISVAEVLVYVFGLPNISRSCHRSFPVLIKWFDDNWEKIEPHIYNISLLDEQKRQINLSREVYDQINQ